jgi:hypothetical protein
MFGRFLEKNKALTDENNVSEGNEGPQNGEPNCRLAVIPYRAFNSDQSAEQGLASHLCQGSSGGFLHA